MSGLAAVVAGRVPAGAYRWRSALGVDRVREVVTSVGWRLGVLEGSRLESRGELFAAVGEALGLEGMHGTNLDALEECLRELDPTPVVLLWEAWAISARAQPRLVEGVLDVLGATVPSAWVLLRGEVPDQLRPRDDLDDLDDRDDLPYAGCS